jgi:hypothetical protein
MCIATPSESPPVASSSTEDCEIVFHESPAVFVRVSQGVAKLHAYLSGFDVEAVNTADVRHLARCMVAAAEAVDLLNSRRSEP